MKAVGNWSGLCQEENARLGVLSLHTNRISNFTFQNASIYWKGKKILHQSWTSVQRHRWSHFQAMGASERYKYVLFLRCMPALMQILPTVVMCKNRSEMIAKQIVSIESRVGSFCNMWCFLYFSFMAVTVAPGSDLSMMNGRTLIP